MSETPSPAPADPEEELRRRFPEMKPTHSAPILFRLNGCGFGLYGSRDRDAATETRVKTRCVSVLWLPVFPLDAWRIADADRGWYFLGRVPLGVFAKGMRLFVVVTLSLTMIRGAWERHQNSPERQLALAERELAEAIEAGRPLDAAGIRVRLIEDRLGDADVSLEHARRLLEAEISSGDAARAEAALAFALERPLLPNGGELLPGRNGLALDAAESLTEDPAGALRLLYAIEPRASEVERAMGLRLAALERMEPLASDDLESRERLALCREWFGQIDGALDLLEPVAGRLGDGEGARLYGMLRIERGEAEEGIVHLERYTRPRIDAWRRAEERLGRAFEEARDRAFDSLNLGHGPEGFEEAYEAADEDGQAAMVNEYLRQALARSLPYQRAVSAYREVAAVESALLRLGMARLQLGRATADPDSRVELLDQAEQDFLLLRNVAEDGESYELLLAQVDYWSGREARGRERFEALLEARGRDPEALFQVADLYRDLGEESAARHLLEEAYEGMEGAGEREFRDAIARLRSMLARSTRERIEWLEKGSPASPLTVRLLAEARGHEAEESGEIEAAIGHYRRALDGYLEEGRDAAVLNNAAILHRAIYRLSGDPADFEASVHLFSEAVALSPSSSILAQNAAEAQLAAAVMRVAGERLDPAIAALDSGFAPLRFLYHDEATKQVVVAALTADPDYRRAVRHFQEVQVLAPRNLGLYSWGAGLFHFTRDESALAALVERAAAQDFDHETQDREYASFIAGERDDELRAAVRAGLASAARLAARPGSPGPALAHQAAAATAGFSLGDADCPVDADLAARLQAALADGPSVRGREALEAVTAILALREIAATDPAAGEWIEAHRRLLAPDPLLVLLLEADEDEAFRPLPRVLERVELARLGMESFPRQVQLAEWRLLNAARAADRDEWRERVSSREPIVALQLALARATHPPRPATMLMDLWQAEFDGDSAAAAHSREVLRQAGVRLPGG